MAEYVNSELYCCYQDRVGAPTVESVPYLALLCTCIYYIIGDLVVAELVDSKWYRGCVQQVRDTGDDEERSALILFICIYCRRSSGG